MIANQVMRGGKDVSAEGTCAKAWGLEEPRQTHTSKRRPVATKSQGNVRKRNETGCQDF